jgi:hypothetical protein
MPHTSYRWSPNVGQQNPNFLTQLDRALENMDYWADAVIEPQPDVVVSEEPAPVDEPMTVARPAGAPEYTGRRVVVSSGPREVGTPISRVTEININVPIEESEPEADEEVIVGELEFTPAQLRLIREYEQKIALVSKHGINGRFLKHNLVWHPVYGSGTVESQHGSKQTKVKFHRPHGMLVVMEDELTEDTEAIARVELMTCTECGKPFPRGDRGGRFPLYCSQLCRRRRNSRVRAETAVRAAEKAAKVAERNVEALHKPSTAPAEGEPVAAIMAEVPQSPVYEGNGGTHVDIVLRMPNGQPKTAKFLSVEDAVNYLMEKL